MRAEDIALALGGKRSGDGWLCPCPAHDDQNPSLSIKESSDGKILVYCRAGCTQEEVIEKFKGLGLWKTTNTNRNNWTPLEGKMKTETEEAPKGPNEEALKKWGSSKEANPNHPYIVRKKISPEIAKLRQIDRELVIPILDKEKNLTSLQFIDENGNKKFFRGGRAKGGFLELCNGDLSPEKIIICEGVATGSSIRESTNYHTVIAFSCGNLSEVGREVREKYPEAEIIIAADDDFKNEKNPGLTKANEVASEVNGLVAIPTFEGDRGDGKDFNDLFIKEGAFGVGLCIALAEKSPPAEPLISSVGGVC